MSDPRTQDARFAALLVQLGLVGPGDVQEAWRESAGPGSGLRLGDALLRRGALSYEGLEKAFRARPSAVLVRCPRCSREHLLLPAGRGGPVSCLEPGCPGRVAPLEATVAAPALEDVSAAPVEVRRAAADPERVFGKYVLLEEVGRGGMGAVYRAWDVPLRRDVAVKVLTLSEEPADKERFFREARTIAALSHPHIAQVYDVGEIDGRPYLAMQFVRGRSLEGRKFPPRVAAALLRDAALAVHAAHEQGIVHRDLKPGNLMVGEDGHLFVLDFGLARSLRSDVRLTASGIVMGTPAYMPPEQARGEINRIGPASDVYSLGASLYELLTGKTPFRGKTVLDTIEAVLERNPVRPRTYVRNVPPEIERICLVAMDKDPARRQESAQALADDLGRFLDQGSPGRGATGRAANPRALLAGVAVGLAVLGAAGLALALRPEEEASGPSTGTEEEAGPERAPDPAAEEARARFESAWKAFAEPGASWDAFVRDSREALEILEESRADHLALRSRIHLAIRMPDEALLDLDRAIELDPADRETRFARGRLRLEMHRRERRRREWRWAAPEDDPELRKGLEEAALDLREAARGEDPKAELARAVLAGAEGREEAFAILDRLVEGDPDSLELLYLRGDTHLWLAWLGTDARRHVVAAERDLARYVSNRPNDLDAVVRFVSALVQAKRFTEAGTLLPRIQGAEDPLVHEVWVSQLHGLAEAKASTGLNQDFQAFHEGAISYIQAYALFGPPSAPLLRQLAWSLFCLGDFDEADRSIEAALSLNRDHPILQAMKALVLVSKGDALKARTYSGAAVRTEPNDWLTLWASGVARARTGQTAEAADDLRKALALDPPLYMRRTIETQIEGLR